MTLRVGIIGAGQVGERHAIGFAAVEGASLVGIADIVEERAATLAERFGARAFTDWRRMLDSGLDIVVVGLPHNLHVEPTEAAAAQGVHVLMEKPIATTLEDGKRIISVCEAAGVKLATSFVHRFRDEVQIARQWLDEGKIGVPQVAREVMNGQRGPHLPAWVTQETIAGGGVLMYNAIHAIDRLRWLLASEVTTVTAQIREYDPHSEVEDSVAALLNFANGAAATLTANAPAYWAQPAYWETEIYGSAGLLRVRTGDWIEISSDQRMLRLETHTADSRGGRRYNFIRQAAAFVDAIREDREPSVTGEDGIRALEVALAIYHSAATHQPVYLPH